MNYVTNYGPLAKHICRRCRHRYEKEFIEYSEGSKYCYKNNNYEECSCTLIGDGQCLKPSMPVQIRDIVNICATE